MLRRPTSRTEHCHASSLPSSSPCSTGVCQWGAGPATRPRQPAASRPCRVLLQAKPPSEDATATQRKTPTLPGDPHSSWRACPPPPPTLPADSWLEIEAHHPPPPPLECTPSFHFSQPGGCCVPPLAPTATDAQGRAPATSLAAAPPPFVFASGAARRPEMLGRTTTTGPLEPVCAMCTTDWGGRARTHRPPARDLRVQGLYG